MRLQRVVCAGGKWAASVLLLATIAGYIAGSWWSVLYTSSSGLTVGLESGAVVAEWSTGPSSMHYMPRSGMLVRRDRPGDGHSKIVWWPEGYTNAFFARRCLMLPIWIPLLVLAAPTALLWALDRRAVRRSRARACPSCGYDRRGLAADAKCPECGAVPAPAEK